jgi:hypothetical protein
MAIGSSTVNDIAGGVSDLFAAAGQEDKAQSDMLEASNYTAASQLALQNEQFTRQSTAIQESQQNRQITQAMGRTAANVAGAGFANSGTALDLMRSNAQQGALAKAVTSEQGMVTEAGYQEESASYANLATAAVDTANADKNAATGEDIGAILKGVAAVTSLFTPPGTP